MTSNDIAMDTAASRNSQVAGSIFANPIFATAIIGDSVISSGSTLSPQTRERSPISCVEDGWAFRFRLLDDGRRFVSRFFMPGDFIGLQTLLFGRQDSFVSTLSDVRLVHYSPTAILRVLSEDDSAASALLTSAAAHEHLIEDQMCMLGRRAAPERLAWFASYLFERASSRGLTQQGRTLKVPITQLLIADATGLSLVHVNKTLASMERAGILNWSRSELTIRDFDALEALASRKPDRSIDGWREERPSV